MNHEFEKQQAEEEEDMSRRFDDVRQSLSIADDHGVGRYISERFILQVVTQNWYDEAEIGRRLKEHVGEAIDTALEED